MYKGDTHSGIVFNIRRRESNTISWLMRRCHDNDATATDRTEQERLQLRQNRVVMAHALPQESLFFGSRNTQPSKTATPTHSREIRETKLNSEDVYIWPIPIGCFGTLC